MVKHYQFIGQLLLLLLLMAGCEKAVDLGIEEMQSRLVVQSNFQAEQLMEVVVSKSRSVLSNDTLAYLSNVDVRIFQDDQLQEILVLGSNPLFPYPLYKTTSFKPAIGVEYTIEVSAPDFPNPVRATSSIPPSVDIHSVQVTDIKWRVYGPQQALVQYYFTIDVQFDDPATRDNFYHLNFFYELVNFKVENGDTILNKTGFTIPLIITELSGNQPVLQHFNRGVLIDDAAQQGSRYSFTFETQTQPISRNAEVLDILYTELRSVSQDYYRYHTSLTRQSQQTDPLFADPVILYNNIENGYGIFAGYSVAMDSLNVQQ